MTNKIGDTKQRPGTRLMTAGMVLLAFGVLLVIVGFSSVRMEMVPGTFRMIEVPGAPTPFSWIVLFVGVILTAAGFGRRVLSAIEK